MIHRLIAQTRLDGQMLLRLRFLSLAPLLGLLAALLLRGFVPEAARAAALPLGLFALLSAVGLFLGAGMLWLEQSQQVLSALRLTPLRPGEYLGAKGLSQLLLHLAFALPAALGALGFWPGLAPLLAGLAAHSLFLTYFSLTLGLRRPQLARFFPPAFFVLMFLQLPLFVVVEQWSGSAWLALPGAGALAVMMGFWTPGTWAGALVWPLLAWAAAWWALGKTPCWSRW